VLRTAWPDVAAVTDQMLELAPFYRRVISDMIRSYGETFFRRARERINEVKFLCGGDPDGFRQAMSAYVRFGMESLRKQERFARTGRYAVAQFDEVNRSLYANETAMRKFYLPALLLCFVFNPNYYEYYDFFETEFLHQVQDGSLVVEVGCGHGVYLSQTLKRYSRTTGIGLDISQGSLETTRQILAHCGIQLWRTQLSIADVREELPVDDSAAGTVICCEVLEHLPNPRQALDEIRRIAAPDATLMISAAVRMESIDHLYLFRSHLEVRQMIESAGLRIHSERAVPLAKGNLQDREERQRLLDDPRVPVGYICRAS